jgi:PhnB protein
MANKVKPIPDGYEGITPYITVAGAAAAIDFYKQAFGAVEKMRIPASNDRIGHAEIAIGKANIMLSDEFLEIDARSPRTIGGTPVVLHLYVENVDETVRRAEAAGATVLRPPADQFYGDRGAMLRDPFGHKWWLATHIEDVPDDELQRRAAQAHH